MANASPTARRGANLPARAFVSLVLMVALLNSTAASPLYGLYRAKWSIDALTIAAVFSVYAGGTLLALLVLGRLSDRLPDRRIVLCGSVLVVIAGAAVFADASGLHALMLGRFLAGIGTGGITGTANAALLELDPDNNARRAAVLATSVFTAGCAIGPILSSAAIQLDFHPLTSPFLVIIAVAVIGMVGLVLVPWRPVRLRRDVSGRDARPIPPPPPVNRASAFAVAAGGIIIAWSVGSCFAALGPTFVHELLHLDSFAAAGLVVTFHQLVGGLSQIAGGRMSSDRALIIGTALVALSTAGCAMAIAIGSVAFFFLFTLLNGLGYGAAFVGSAGVINRIAPPERRATFVSAYYLIAYLANALPVLALGFLGDRLGMFGGFLSLTAFTIAAAIATILAALRVLVPGWRVPGAAA